MEVARQSFQNGKEQRNNQKLLHLAGNLDVRLKVVTISHQTGFQLIDSDLDVVWVAQAQEILGYYQNTYLHPSLTLDYILRKLSLPNNATGKMYLLIAKCLLIM